MIQHFVETSQPIVFKYHGSARLITHIMSEMSATESEIEDFLNGALVSWVSSQIDLGSHNDNESKITQCLWN